MSETLLPVSVTTSVPDGSTATPVGALSVMPVTVTTEATPVTEYSTIRLLPRSAMKRLPEASTAMPTGLDSAVPPEGGGRGHEHDVVGGGSAELVRLDDAIVAGVCDEDVRIAIDRDALGRAERRAAKAVRGGNQRGGGERVALELRDRVRGAVEHVQVVGPVERDGGWLGEAGAELDHGTEVACVAAEAVRRAAGAGAGDRGSRSGEAVCDHLAIAGIGEEDVAVSIDRKARGPVQRDRRGGRWSWRTRW